ncbi:MAG: hypothetical protein HRU09_10470 [Oligoflexales bacterium]|nr:hypothetical protein [Oligoflexales bacterium]
MIFLNACSESNFSDSKSLGSLTNGNSDSDHTKVNFSEDVKQDKSGLDGTADGSQDDKLEESDPLVPEPEDDTVATPIMTTGAFLIRCHRASENELFCKVVNKDDNTLKTDISSISWEIYQGETLLPQEQINLEHLSAGDDWQIKITIESDEDWRLKPVEKDQDSDRNYEIFMEDQPGETLEEQATLEDQDSEEQKDPEQNDLTDTEEDQSDDDLETEDPTEEQASEYNFPIRYRLSLDAPDRTGKDNNATSFTTGSPSIIDDLDYEFYRGFTQIIWAKTVSPGSDHPRLLSITGNFEAFIKWDHESLKYAGGLGCKEDLIDQNFSE